MKNKSNVNSILGIIVFVILITTPISCNDVGNVKSDITVSNILESATFINFANAHIDYSMPFVEKTSVMDMEEFRVYHEELTQIFEDSKSKQNFEEIVIKMGFESKIHHQNKYSIVKETLNQLLAEFPQLVEKENKNILNSALEIYFTQDLIPYKFKKLNPDLESCQNLALSRYLLRTAGCLTLTALNPLVALGCQVANSAIHNAEQISCLQIYES